MKLYSSIAVLAIGAMGLASCHGSKYMKKFHKEAKKEVGTASIKLKADTVRVIYPELSMFDFNKDQIKEGVKPSLQRFANILVKYDRIDFIINGYTDSVGTDNVNQALSISRANNTKAFFQSNGVSNNRMQANGMGAENPMSTNMTEEGRSKNRRVEFLLYEKKQK